VCHRDPLQGRPVGLNSDRLAVSAQGLVSAALGERPQDFGEVRTHPQAAPTAYPELRPKVHQIEQGQRLGCRPFPVEHGVQTPSADEQVLGEEVSVAAADRQAAEPVDDLSMDALQ
jgi:hypothetical protein